MLAACSYRLGITSKRSFVRIFSALAICVTALAATSVLADEVRTRAWAHDGFGRIVFDWPREVTYESHISGQTLTVAFEREITTTFQQVQRRLEAYIAEVKVAPDGRTVVASLKGDYRLRTLKSESGIVIDLVPVSGTPAPTSQAANTAPAAKVGVRLGEHAEFTRIVFDWTRSVDYKVERGEGSATVEFNAPGAIDVARLSSRRGPRILGAETRSTAQSSSVQLSIGGSTRLRHFRSGTKVVLDVLDGPGATTTGDSGSKPAAAPVNSARKSPSTKQAAPTAGLGSREAQGSGSKNPKPPGAGNLNVALASDNEDGVRISIVGEVGAALAVFLRAGYAWVVLDTPAAATIDEIPEVLAETVFLAEQVELDGAAALRFKIRSGLGPVVQKTEGGWVVGLTEDAPLPEDSIKIARQETSGGESSALLRVSDPGPVIELSDPEVGDTIFIVPLKRIGRGVSPAQEYVEFRMLETIQGIAIAPLADHIRLTGNDQGVVIGGEFGLALSARDGEARKGPEVASADVGESGGAAAAAAAAEEVDEDEEQLDDESEDLDDEDEEDFEEDVDVAEVQMPLAKEIYKYDEWYLGSIDDFQELKQDLQVSIANTPAAERNEKRWGLARFYFAHGFAADALGVLRLIADHEPRIVQDPEFISLRGACHFLMAHIDWAEEDLFTQGLDGEPEIALWRGAVYAEKQEWELARDEFAFGGSVIDRFPADIRARFMLASAKVALEIEQFDMLDEDLTLLAAEDLAPKHQAQADFVRGQALELIGDEDGALDAYASSIDFAFRPIRARSELARVNLLFKRQELSFEDALEGLESLRFTWRGDDFEFNLLRRLGELYVERGVYREGLTAMREAVTHFRDTPESRKLQEAMDDVFRQLFLEGDADQMEPVRALALYYDFRELTPVGKEGDEMIRQLADRLVAVDLLDRAAQLLEHQVKFRLRREKKAQVGVRLAAIHLMDKQPEKVLEVLKYSRWKPLPRETIRERKFLEARAHAALGKYQDALTSLVGEKSREARLIRSDVYWRSKDWSNAAATMGLILGERWKDDTPPTDEERNHIMRLAVALVLANDKNAVKTVRTRYQRLMKSTPDSDAFEIVTREVDPSTIEFRKVAAAVAQIDTLDSFMSRYAGTERVEAVN